MCVCVCVCVYTCVFLTSTTREATDGNTRNVHLLLEAGVSIESKQENVIGFTTLNQTAYLGHKPVVKLLLLFGAQFDCIDGYGGMPLVAAALNGEFECVQMLIKGGVIINHKTTNGNTPLMKAAINGHVDCVKWLIIQGPNIDEKNNNELTSKDQTKEFNDHTEKVATAAATAAEQLQQQPKEEQDRIEHITLLQHRYEKSIDNLKKVIRALDEGAKLIELVTQTI